MLCISSWSHPHEAAKPTCSAANTSHALTYPYLSSLRSIPVLKHVTLTPSLSSLTRHYLNSPEIFSETKEFTAFLISFLKSEDFMMQVEHSRKAPAWHKAQETAALSVTTSSLTYFQWYLVLTGTLSHSPAHAIKTSPARLLSEITFSGNQFLSWFFVFIRGIKQYISIIQKSWGSGQQVLLWPSSILLKAFSRNAQAGTWVGGRERGGGKEHVYS